MIASSPAYCSSARSGTRSTATWSFAKPAITASCLVLLLVGCQETADPYSEIRGELISMSPPPDAGTIVEAVETLTAPASPDEMTDQVTIRGRIDAGDLDPFEPGRAAFIVSEIIVDPNGGEGHDPSTCPFCKRRAENAPKAHVILVDDSGKPVEFRADRVLGASKGDVVQVAGTASYDESLNTLTVTASKIHVE